MPTAVSRACAALAFALALLAGVSHASRAQSEADPATIVERADRIRFPAESFQTDVRITTTAPGRQPEVREYRILAKGTENSLVMTTAPAAERGQILLLKGRDLWAFLPRVSQPVRLPLSQKLTGQVANGDLARANFAGDYTPRLLRTETVDGKQVYVLELEAVDRGVTYPRALYWVEADTFRPHKAEFYTLSGRLFKTCRYEGYQRIAGEVRPTRLVMANALREGEQSVMDYFSMEPRDLPDIVFTKEYLKKLQ